MQTLIDQITTATLDALRDEATIDGVDPELLEKFVAPPRTLLQGGKRIRGILSIAGGMCVSPGVDEDKLRVAAALELFQGAALVHDDIMDQSPTRRGQPAVHVAFGHGFEDDGLVGERASYETNAGICSGDFLLSLATTHMLGCPRISAIRRFQGMCSEVAYGQFLDVRAENIDLSHGDDLDAEAARDFYLDLRTNAFNVLRHKSAHYSVRDPLLIGADAAGADDELLSLLSTIGVPLGEAFQLRDDALGLLGDPKSTGKPTGGDLREGKRTVLLLTTLARLAGTDEARQIISLLGTDVSEADVQATTAIMMECGAWDEHEALIADAEERAHRQWEKLPHSEGAELLATLMTKLTGRRY